MFASKSEMFSAFEMYYLGYESDYVRNLIDNHYWREYQAWCRNLNHN